MKAKIGRQYVLHRSVSALRAVSSPAAESAQARTTLQRVVEKRSGDRLPSVTVSGVTVFDHRIYGMLGKLKRWRRRGVGAAAARHGPLSTSHHLSTIKRSIGGCLSIVVLRKLHSEVFERLIGSVPLHLSKPRYDIGGCSPDLDAEQAALLFEPFQFKMTQRSRWHTSLKFCVRCITDSARLAE